MPAPPLHVAPVSTLAEIQAAVEALSPQQKEEFLAYVEKHLRSVPDGDTSGPRGLKAAARPALEGLPPDLSIGTKERVRKLIAAQNVADR